MKQLPKITALGLALSGMGHAESWQDLISKLSNDDFTTRVQSQKDVISKISTNATPASLANAMNTLLVRYSHSSDPELKLRILYIMQAVSTPYRKSLGSPLMGAMIESDKHEMHGKLFAMVLVSEVREGSPSASAGLKPGDRIFSVAQYDLRKDFSVADTTLSSIIDSYAPGETVRFGVLRDETQLTINVTLGRFSEKQPNLLSKFLDTKGEQVQSPDTSILENLKHPIRLPEYFDNGSFFARWFKRQQR